VTQTAGKWHDSKWRRKSWMDTKKNYEGRDTVMKVVQIAKTKNEKAKNEVSKKIN
jgi:hypothetical protein